MADKNLYEEFYDVIDSNFKDYEESGYNDEIYIDLQNNIAKKMLEVFKKKYGEEHEIYLHCSMVYMKTINDCISGYKKKTSEERTGQFHTYFFSTLRKNINEACRLDREMSGLGVSFGTETEKSSAARIKLRNIEKYYNDLQNYDDSLSEDQVIEEIAFLMNIETEEIKRYLKFIKGREVNAISQKKSGEEYSPIDSDREQKNRQLEIPENLIISKDNMKLILDKINDVVYNQTDKEADDILFLSKVITYKILDAFDPPQRVDNGNISGTDECVSYLPESYNLQDLLFEYKFIDKRMVQDFFNGIKKSQKEIEKESGYNSSGALINTWKRFNNKLLKKYRPDLDQLKE